MAFTFEVTNNGNAAHFGVDDDDGGPDRISTSTIASPRDPRRIILKDQQDELNALAEQYGRILASLQDPPEKSHLSSLQDAAEKSQSLEAGNSSSRFSSPSPAKKFSTDQCMATQGDAMEDIMEDIQPEMPFEENQNEQIPYMQASSDHAMQHPYHQAQHAGSTYPAAYPMAGVWPQVPSWTPVTEPPWSPYAQYSAGDQNGAQQNANGSHQEQNGSPHLASDSHASHWSYGSPSGQNTARSWGSPSGHDTTRSWASEESVMHYQYQYLTMPNANLFFWMHARHMAQRQAQQRAQEYMALKQAKEYRDNIGKQAMQQWLWSQKLPEQRNEALSYGPPDDGYPEFGHVASEAGSGYTPPRSGGDTGSHSGSNPKSGSDKADSHSGSYGYGSSGASGTHGSSHWMTRNSRTREFSREHLDSRFDSRFLHHSHQKHYSKGGAQGTLSLQGRQMVQLAGRTCVISKRREGRNARPLRFTQQEFVDEMWPSWFYTPRQLGICSQILGIVMIIAGALMLGVNSGIKEVELGYTANDSSIDFELSEDMKGPVMFYYHLSGFFGNYRTYVESKDDFVFSSTFAKYNCEGSKVKNDVKIVRPGDFELQQLVDTAADGDDDELRPCGMVALTFFMDEYNIAYQSDDGAFVSLDQSDLSWISDDAIVDDKIVRSGSNLTIEGVRSWLPGSMMEHFKVWYRTSASSNFRQLWARIPDGLRAGKYTVNILSNGGIWDHWDVKRSIVLSQVSAFGSRNLFLGQVYIIWGVLIMVSSAIVYFGPPVGLLRWWRNLTEPVAPPLPEPSRTDHELKEKQHGKIEDVFVEGKVLKKNSRGSTSNLQQLEQSKKA